MKYFAVILEGSIARLLRNSKDPGPLGNFFFNTPTPVAKIVTVQYVGEDREAVRREKDLSVSVERLRAAFRWLSLNSWPFMEATKDHEVWERGSLHEDLEALLAAYEESVGGKSGGTPAEIVQGASRIAAENAFVHGAGPADALASVEGDDGEALIGGLEASLIDANCAAVVDGGVDDFSPTQLWDIVMKKYKVAQLCEDELKRLAQKDEATKKDQLRQEKVLALAEAVDALGRLHHRETRAKLKDFAKKY